MYPIIRFDNIKKIIPYYMKKKMKENSISMLRNYAFSAYIVIVLQGVTSLEFKMMRLDMQN